MQEKTRDLARDFHLHRAEKKNNTLGIENTQKLYGMRNLVLI